MMCSACVCCFDFMLMCVAGWFCLTCGHQVVLEETTSAGACDTAPMSLYDLWVRLEKEGAVNMKFTGHSVERPASVQRGEDSDSLLPLS